MDMAEKYVITIDRLYGSGGRIMGRKLSEELGIPFYDEEILKMASEESAVSENLFRLNDEKAGSNLFFRAVGGLHTSLEEPSVDDDVTSPENLFRFQARMIRRVAAEQSCIIMGRCADFVLNAVECENLIRLFVYADITTCIRRDYYKYYTGKEWEDMANYDLPINASALELDQAAELVKTYLRLRGIRF